MGEVEVSCSGGDDRVDDVEERGVGEDGLNLCWEHLNGYGAAREGGSELYYVRIIQGERRAISIELER